MKDKAEAAKDKVKESTHNVFSGTVKAIDKAKGVGSTLMDEAAEQRRIIEEDSN